MKFWMIYYFASNLILGIFSLVRYEIVGTYGLAGRRVVGVTPVGGSPLSLELSGLVSFDAHMF